MTTYQRKDSASVPYNCFNSSDLWRHGLARRKCEARKTAVSSKSTLIETTRRRRERYTHCELALRKPCQRHCVETCPCWETIGTGAALYTLWCMLWASPEQKRFGYGNTIIRLTGHSDSMIGTKVRNAEILAMQGVSANQASTRPTSGPHHHHRPLIQPQVPFLTQL